jgi:hypothetical protein
MLKWVKETTHVRGVLSPSGPSDGVTVLEAPVYLLWVSAQLSLGELNSFNPD